MRPQVELQNLAMGALCFLHRKKLQGSASQCFSLGSLGSWLKVQFATAFACPRGPSCHSERLPMSWTRPSWASWARDGQSELRCLGHLGGYRVVYSAAGALDCKTPTEPAIPGIRPYRHHQNLAFLVSAARKKNLIVLWGGVRWSSETQRQPVHRHNQAVCSAQ